jgi:hypothetical protein
MISVVERLLASRDRVEKLVSLSGMITLIFSYRCHIFMQFSSFEKLSTFLFSWVYGG